MIERRGFLKALGIGAVAVFTGGIPKAVELVSAYVPEPVIKVAYKGLHYLGIEDYSERYLKPAIQEWADAFDRDLISLHVKGDFEKPIRKPFRDKIKLGRSTPRFTLT